jgi:hypothetical protein
MLMYLWMIAAYFVPMLIFGYVDFILGIKHNPTRVVISGLISMLAVYTYFVS